MQTSVDKSSALYRALTLSERAPTLITGQTDGVPIDDERARLRLERWRTQPPFQHAGSLAARLRIDGVGEAEIFHLLGQSDDSVQHHCPAEPPWLTELSAALAAAVGGDPLAVPETAKGYALAPALHVIAPLVRTGKQRLGARAWAIAAAHPGAPFRAETIVDTLYEQLAPQLVQMLGRVMALELNVARLRDELTGDTPEQRAAAFFTRLAEPQALTALFEEYPVLARRLVERIAAWVDASAEFLTRLAQDWEAIQTTLLGGTDPGVLCHVEGGGDTHRGGRAVCIARFASGRKVVYKPRCLAVDQHFQELLGWLNQRGQEPAFRPLLLLQRGDYGWVEFVHATGCTTAEEIRRFYARQGGYLALLYALDAADFHHENLLAAGEHPMFIDLEALLHPRFSPADQTSSTAQAGAVLDDSVLRIGLLPHRLHTGPDGRGMDISGLGGAAGQLTPFTVPYWERRGTDEVYLSRKSVEIPAAQNRPLLAGTPVDVLEYTDALLAGFDRTYGLLLAGRDDLGAPDGPLARFGQDEIRVIVRPTAHYDELLNLSYHPDTLRDALDRDRHFDRLFVAVTQQPQLAAVFGAEHADLRSGDIPLFTTRPSSRDLWTAHGQRIEGYLAQSSLTSVTRRLQRLSAADRAAQVHIIRCSLATLRVGRDVTTRTPQPLPRPQAVLPPAALDGRLVAAARRIGDQLAATAIGAGGQTTWVGMTLLGDRYWALAPLDTDLYTGLPGVALFFGALAAVTREQRYAELAHRTLATLTARLDTGPGRLTNLGGFSGWGGVIYVLSQLGQLLQAPQLHAQAAEYAQRIPQLVEKDDQLDLINGSAGCILALLSAHRATAAASLLATATQCGKRLLATARDMEQGLAWQTPMSAARPLCGLSHGASGMALALAALGTATGDPAFQKAARGALDYEAREFCGERRNWPDWRFEEAPGSAPVALQADYMVTWCHGAPGIGLARLGMLADFDGPQVRADLQAAVATTLAEGFGKSHSLCHGDTGNLELLAQASRVLKDATLAQRVRDGAAAVLETIERTGWRCGVPTGVEAPGLMMGLSGIGYGLLRLARPQLVPSVLTLSSAAEQAP